ncbi:MAG: hypothetical protein AAF604_16220 [Acidobacteriota bacterium]
MSVIINELEVSLAEAPPVAPGADPGPPPSGPQGKVPITSTDLADASEQRERRRRRLEAW